MNKVELLNNIQRENHRIAKNYWWKAKLLGIIVFCLSILSLLITNQNEFFFIFGLISILSIIQHYQDYLSDNFKSKAQKYLRQMEFNDSLKWEINEWELANLRVTQNEKVKKEMDKSSPYQFFSSTEVKENRKLIDNLLESTFYTHYLATKSRDIFLLASLVISITTAVIFYININTTEKSVLTNLMMIVVSLFTFLFTSGLLRLTYEYHQISQISEKCAEEAYKLLKEKKGKFEEAINLCFEYQIARSNSPLIFDFVYKKYKNEIQIEFNKFKFPNSS